MSEARGDGWVPLLCDELNEEKMVLYLFFCVVLNGGMVLCAPTIKRIEKKRMNVYLPFYYRVNTLDKEEIEDDICCCLFWIEDTCVLYSTIRKKIKKKDVG